jgi:hypothetical protein
VKIASRYGQPWSEAKAMTETDRKAFLYVAAEFEGFRVDWQTGQLIPPKPQ